MDCPLLKRALALANAGELTVPEMVIHDIRYEFLVTSGHVGGESYQRRAYVSAFDWDYWSERLDQLTRDGLWSAFIEIHWTRIPFRSLREWAPRLPPDAWITMSRLIWGDGAAPSASAAFVHDHIGYFRDVGVFPEMLRTAPHWFVVVHLQSPGFRREDWSSIVQRSSSLHWSTVAARASELSDQDIATYLTRSSPGRPEARLARLPANYYHSQLPLELKRFLPTDICGLVGEYARLTDLSV